MTSSELAKRLVQSAESVAIHLLPAGKKIGGDWVIGSVRGEPGESCKVSLEGGRAGKFKDFESGEGGDLLDLWALARGLSAREAFREAKGWLGIAEPVFHPTTQRTYAPAERLEVAKIKPSSPVMKYLSGERGLSGRAIEAYRLGEDGKFVVFPFLKDSNLVFWKKKQIQKYGAGKRPMHTAKNAEHCLFGWQAIDAVAREVAIFEGEEDAMSGYDYGWPGLSVPNGAPALTWIDADFDRLERFDTIYLCFDMDEAGQAAVPLIASRLGFHRCRVVRLPRKDLNQCLTDGIEKLEIENCFRTAATIDPEELKSASRYADKVINLFHPANGCEPGFDTPWEKLHDKFRFRPGEVTVLTGINGHGKSQIVAFMTLAAMVAGVRACVASLEMPPARWLARLTRQAAAKHTPSVDHIMAVHAWYGGRLWVFEVVRAGKVERILEVFTYARHRYGIDLFVIDNLAKCGLALDDHNGQKLFMENLTDFAKHNETHVILVAHPRKPGDETHVPGKADVKGAGEITDLADNTLFVWRNKAKEKAFQENPHDPKLQDEFDTLFGCDKQRNGDWEGSARFWFDRATYQFLENKNAFPREFVPEDGRQEALDPA